VKKSIKKGSRKDDEEIGRWGDGGIGRVEVIQRARK
jgi:hypothetical protein